MVVASSAGQEFSIMIKFKLLSEGSRHYIIPLRLRNGVCSRNYNTSTKFNHQDVFHFPCFNLNGAIEPAVDSYCNYDHKSIGVAVSWIYIIPKTRTLSIVNWSPKLISNLRDSAGADFLGRVLLHNCISSVVTTINRS